MLNVMDALKLLPKLTRKAGKGSSKRSLRKRQLPATTATSSTTSPIFSGLKSTPAIATVETDIFNLTESSHLTCHTPLTTFTRIHAKVTISRPSNNPCSMAHQGVFPFQKLPNTCQFKIFSYLNVVDKGRSSRVCRHWNEMMRSPHNWEVVDLTSDFSMACLPSAEHQPNEAGCNDCYCKRVHHFLTYLSGIQPVLKRLDFCYDIGESENRYLDSVKSMLQKSNCQNLRYVRVNWKALQDLWPDSLHPHYKDQLYSIRLKQRRFTYFFDDFTTIAPSLTTLILPFDWNTKAVECLTRLKDLQSLVLKHLCVDSFEQGPLDHVLSSLSSLKRLILEVRLMSGDGLIPFTLKSPSLEYLDISESHGIYLNQLDMPHLKGIRIARHFLLLPLKTYDLHNLPCLHQVFSEGAPNLLKINDHYLSDNWHQDIYSTLDEVLRVVCSCRWHVNDLWWNTQHVVEWFLCEWNLWKCTKDFKKQKNEPEQQTESF